MKPARSLLASLAVLAAACSPPPAPVAEVKVSPERIELGYPLATTVYFAWRTLTEIDGDPTVFVHLHDHPESVARTFDHRLPSEWEAGDAIEYELLLYQSALGPPLEPGSYRIGIGLYEGERRWPLETAGEELNEHEYVAFEVEVPAAGTAPAVEFSPEWGPLEAGVDLQHLGRRQLAGEGSLTVADLDAPAELNLGLWVTPLEPDDAGVPAIVIDTDCGEDTIRIDRFGRHRVALRLEATMQTAATEAPACRVEVRREPADPGGLISLENLAWSDTGS